MALSKCVKCENTSFEIRLAEPSGTYGKVKFVQCSNCGTVAGALDIYVYDALKKIAARLGVNID